MISRWNAGFIIIRRKWNVKMERNYIKYYRSVNYYELPNLGEEILIEFKNETNPNRPPFVGYFEENRDGHVWMIVSANGGMSLYEVQDGVKWTRFNRPIEF